MHAENVALVLPAEACHLHTRATPLRILNFLTVGEPCFLVPEEAVETGFVELAPDTVRELTVKIPSFFDFYGDRIQVDMWRINGTAPNRTLEWIAPYGPTQFGVAPTVANVRIRLEDAGYQVDLLRQEVPWQHFASDAMTPHRLQAPLTWQGGRVYKVAVRSYETAQALAISITFVGRRRRVEQSQNGWNSDERKLLDWYLAREKELGNTTRGYLNGDHSQNIRSIGRLKYTALPLQPIPITIGAMDTILQRSPNQAIVGMAQRYYYNVRQMMGSQEQALVKIDGSVAPIFTRIFNDNEQYWITNGWVPFRTIYGSGEQPGRLPVDWAWGRNAQIRFEFKSATTVATNVMVDIEGMYRALAPMTGNGEGW